jgi:DMSO/TMAO reductase YedYZ molybdopterin-dependent catalytic subunit
VDETPTELQPSTPERSTHRVGRAVFLGAVAGGVSSLLWGKAAWGRLSAAISPVENHIPLLPSGGWRIYSVSGSLPKFDAKTWQLQIGGHVETPTTIRYDELLALPKVEQVSTFHCVTGWTVKNVQWGGVRLGEVLALAKPRDVAHAIEFVSAEKPYVDSLTLGQAALHDVMLAYEMDGKPLPRAHGAPLRLVIPEMYGYKNVKWLAGINMVGKVEDGYWEQLGYDRDAWVGRSNGYGT